MIRIGLSDADKGAVVDRYVQEHGITKVIVISPERFAPSWAPNKITAPEQLDGGRDWYLPYPCHIQYRYYYRIIRLIDHNTLVVLNECARGGFRRAIQHNCVRTFVQTTKHQIVFQHLPMTTVLEDSMTLVDWDTRSRWFNEKEPRPEMLSAVDIQVQYREITVEPTQIITDEATTKLYEKERSRLFALCRADVSKDPHQIPRNLVVVSGKAKAKHLRAQERYVARNARLHLPNVETFEDVATPGCRTFIDPPHRFLTLTDYLTVAQTNRIPILVANTKADAWYLDRLQKWVKEVNRAAAILQR